MSTTTYLKFKYKLNNGCLLLMDNGPNMCKPVPKTKNRALAGVKCTLYGAYGGKSE